MAFDPQAFLAEEEEEPATTGFDPAAFLAEPAPAPPAAPRAKVGAPFDLGLSLDFLASDEPIDALTGMAKLAPTGLRIAGAVGPPVAAAVYSGGLSLPASMGLSVGGAAAVEPGAQWLEKQLGLRDEYSAATAAIHVGTAGLGPVAGKAGTAAAKLVTGAPVVSPGLNAGQKFVGAAIRGGEGAAINVGSGAALRAVEGEEITPGTLLADGLLGFGFGAAAGYAFDELARKLTKEQMMNLGRKAGFVGETFDDLGKWWRATQDSAEGAAKRWAARASESFNPQQFLKGAPNRPARNVTPNAPEPTAPTAKPANTSDIEYSPMDTDGGMPGTGERPDNSSEWITPPPEAANLKPGEDLLTILESAPVKEFPVDQIVVNKDVPQFKANGNSETGVVEKLGGQKFRRFPIMPIQVWEKLNGEVEVITGRHRLDLAKRTGEKTIPVQVAREKDGFTQAQATVFDAQANIRDGQGEIKDYAHYFRQAQGRIPPDQQAELTGRAKGRAGWHLGNDAEDGLYDLYANGKIAEAKAVAIAKGAPGHEAAQNSALKVAKGKTAGELELYAANLARLAPVPGSGGSEQMGFGGIDKDFADFEAEAQAIADVQSAAIKENTDLILAAQGAAKRPEAARKMGLPVDDPEALAAQVAEVRAANEKLQSPDANTFEMLRRKAGLPPREVAPPEPTETAPAVVDAEGQTGIFDGSDDANTFNLSGEEQTTPTAPEPPVDNTAPLFGDEVKSTAPTDLDKANQAGVYAVGDKMFRGGEELTITSEPYKKVGAEWQDAVNADGKTKTVPTPRQEQISLDERKAQYRKEQEAYKRLNRGEDNPDDGQTLADGGPSPVQRHVDPTKPPTGAPPFDPKAPVLWSQGQGKSKVYVQVPLRHLNGLSVVRMPELVRLVQMLTGSRPTVTKLRAALGMFYGGGRGRISLDPRIFSDPEAAAKTLAHEIGHLLDYLPDRTLKRGNVLGRLSTARDYLISTLPDRPRNPNKALTTEDRKALYNQAGRNTTAKHGRRPPKDGPKADPVGHRTWGESRSKEYAKLVEDEIQKRGLIRADELREEMIQLSDYWKPYLEQAKEGLLPDHYIKYRVSAPELYADAFSILLNSPATLQERAPLFFKGFFGYLRNKPDAYRALLQVYEWTAGRGKGKRIFDLRDEELRMAMRNGEEIIMRKAAEREAQRRSWQGFADDLQQELSDAYWPVIKRERAAIAAGKEIPLSKSPTVLTQEQAFADNAPYRYLQQIHDTVVKPLEAMGVSTEDYGLFLFHNRIVDEAFQGDIPGRNNVANPTGVTPREAREGLRNWRMNHGLDKFQLMQGTDRQFRSLNQQVLREAVESGVYSRKAFEEVIAPSADKYAAFAVLDYLSDSVPAGMQVGEGTFKDIANSFTATTLKMLNLRRWIQRNNELRETVKFMSNYASDEISPARTRYNKEKKRHEPLPPPHDDDRKMIEVFVDGKPKGFYVPQDVARIFEKNEPGRIAAALRPMHWFFREGVYPLWITYNPFFQLFSGPQRDLRRTWRNMPAGSGAKVANEFLANYGTLLGEAGVHTVRALGRIPGLDGLKGFDPGVRATEASKAVRAHLEGRSDPLINEMMANNAIGVPMDNFRSGLYDERDALQVTMQKLNMLPGSSEHRDLSAVLRSFLKGIEYSGLTFELLAKVAPYKILRKRGVPPREAAHFVRNFVGVPNFNQKGLLTRESGTFLPFINVFEKGLRSDARLAGRKNRPAGAGSRSGWWLRFFLASGMFAVIRGLSKIGVFGEEQKKAYDRISDYDNTNYTTFPLGSTVGGEVDGKQTVYLRLAEDETDRLLSGFIYKTIVMAGGEETSKANILSFGAGQVPGINPLISMGSAWTKYLGGYNPRDGLRDSPILTNDVWLEGGWPAFRDMSLWTAQETGVANFVRYDPHANTTLEAGIQGIPGLGRVLKVSDYGLMERQRADELEEREAGAIFRNSLPTDVQRLRQSYFALRNLGQDRTSEQDRRYMELGVWYNSVYRPAENSALNLGGEGRLTREQAKKLKERSQRYLSGN